MTFYEHLASQYVRDHPGRQGEARGAVGEAALAAERLRDERAAGRRDELDIGRRVVEPAYMWSLYVLAVVGLFFAPRAFVALALLLLAYQTLCAPSSSARRAIASRGTSCSRCSLPRRSRGSRMGAGAARVRVAARPPDPRHRRLGAAPADAAACARRARHRAGVRRARRPGVGSRPTSTARCACRRCASRRRATSTRCCSCGSRGSLARRHRAHAPRARRRLRRPRREAARRALVSTKHNDDPFRARAVPPRRARPLAARRPIVITITDALRRLHGRARRRAGRRRSRRSTTGSTACPRRGA